jgi:hypothetical protein
LCVWRGNDLPCIRPKRNLQSLFNGVLFRRVHGIYDFIYTLPDLIVNLKIPEPDYLPALTTQGNIHFLVSLNIPLYFHSPKLSIAFKAMYLCRHVPITVPKRAVAENSNSMLYKCKVGCSLKISIALSVAKAGSP